MRIFENTGVYTGNAGAFTETQLQESAENRGIFRGELLTAGKPCNYSGLILFQTGQWNFGHFATPFRQQRNIVYSMPPEKGWCKKQFIKIRNEITKMDYSSNTNTWYPSIWISPEEISVAGQLFNNTL